MTTTHSHFTFKRLPKPSISFFAGLVIFVLDAFISSAHNTWALTYFINKLVYFYPHSFIVPNYNNAGYRLQSREDKHIKLYDMIDVCVCVCVCVGG